MKFIFNMYTGPAYLGAVLGVVNIVLLVFLFKIRKLATSDHSKIKMKKVLTGVCVCVCVCVQYCS